jgi:serralysin
LAQLNARETLFLELINRARLDPLAEAVRIGLSDLNDGLAPGTISTTAKQILAPNLLLTDAALAHSAWMNAADVFSHIGSGGSSPSTRVQAAGYPGGAAENISWSGSTSQTGYNANSEVLMQHSSLFLSAGHRTNILGEGYREIGVGTNLGFYLTGGTNYYGMMSTFNFASSGSAGFISGVTYNDASGDAFYSIGEGIGGISVQLLSGGSVVGSATSQSAGAYALPTTEAGGLEIRFSGAGLAGVLGATFSKSGSNVKFDVTGSSGIATNVSAALTQSAAKLTLLGMENVNATGNSLDNVLIGNRGNNTLQGGGGNDRLIGDYGNDTAVFGGTVESYVITYDPSKVAFVFQGSNGSVDTAKGIEVFQFADAVLAVEQLPLAPGSPLPPSIPPDTLTTIISGGIKGEQLIGTDGANIMLGKGGNDGLFAVGGNDILNGGKGRDRLTGGDGEDRFNFSAFVTKKNADKIMDFDPAEDMIGLVRSAFGAIGTKFKPGEFHIGSAAHDATDKIIYNPETGNLRYDVDGTGGTKPVLIANIGVNVALTFDDFMYI